MDKTDNIVTMVIPLEKIELPHVDGTTNLVSEKPAQEPTMAPVASTSQPAKEEESQQERKNKGGRPCKFCQNKDQYLKITEDYLNKCRGRNGAKPGIPYIQELADIIDCDDETIGLWANKLREDESNESVLEHPEFSAIIKKLQTLQRLRLQQRLLGRYNPTGAIFLLKAKHKYIETEKQILAGEKNEPIQIRIVEDLKE